MKNAFIAGLLVLTAISGNTPARAQESSDAVVRELAGIQQSLDSLVRLLETMRRNQDVELILRRIELQERRLAPLENSLRNNEANQIDIRQSITETEIWKASAEEEIEEIEREGIEPVPDDYRRQVEATENQIEALRLRLETLQQRQIELENRLEDGRDEIEILDELLRELLE